MAKTLRVRTRSGWVTKPAADLPANALSAEEIDDNFLAIQAAIAAADITDVGYAELVPADSDSAKKLPMGGSYVSAAQYPDLGAAVAPKLILEPIKSYEDNKVTSAQMRCIDISPDGRYVAIGVDQRPAQVVCTAANYTSVGTVQHSSNPLETEGIAFSPDGLYLACASAGGFPYLTVFNTGNWSEVATPSTESNQRGIAFSPDSSLLCFGDTVYETSGWTVSQALPSVVTKFVEFSPDGAYLAIGKTGSPYLQVYETTSWTAVTLNGTLAGDVDYLSWSPDGAYLAVAVFNNVEPYAVFETAGWTKVGGLPDLPNVYGYMVKFSPDSAYLYFANNSSGSVYVFRVSDWTLLQTTNTPNGSLCVAMVIHPDNETAVLQTASQLFYAQLPKSGSVRIPAKWSPHPALEWRMRVES